MIFPLHIQTDKADSDKFQCKYLQWNLLRAHPKWALLHSKEKDGKLAGDDRPQGQKSAKDDKQKGKSSNSAAAESFAESHVVVAGVHEEKGRAAREAAFDNLAAAGKCFLVQVKMTKKKICQWNHTKYL
jgi:hypothetical protein